MRVINDYQCSDCLKTSEEYREADVKFILCSCGGVKYQVLPSGAYFKINGARMDINTLKWAKTREANSKMKNG